MTSHSVEEPPAVRSRLVGRWIGAGLSIALWIAVFAGLLHHSRFPTLFNRYSKEYFTLLVVVFVAAVLVSVLQVPRVYGVLYRSRYSLFFLLIVCPVMTLVLLEGAMRAFNLFGSDFYSDIRRFTTVLVLDPDLYFKNPANYHGKYSDFEVTTNSMGLRDLPITPPTPGTSSILVLGDSVAFGWGVNGDSAFPHQLETWMAGQHHAVRTINSGVIGYNSRQELTFLRLHANELQPTIVLLVYVDNDIDAIDPQRVHIGLLPNPLKDPAGAADYFLSMSRVYFMFRQMSPVFLGGATTSFQDKRETAGWKDSMQSVAEMAQYCRDRNLPFVVFHFRMLANPVSDALEADLQALAEHENFFYCDTLPWFQGRNMRQLTNSFIDTHPNAAGHQVLAEGMGKFLLQQGLLPDSTNHSEPVKN
jgi:lysophospholipase L1-like esterase